MSNIKIVVVVGDKKIKNLLSKLVKVSCKFLLTNNESIRNDKFIVDLNDWECEYLIEGIFVIDILQAVKQEHLIDYVMRAKLYDIEVHTIFDNDELSIVALGPDYEEHIKKVVGDLKKLNCNIF